MRKDINQTAFSVVQQATAEKKAIKPRPITGSRVAALGKKSVPKRRKN